MFENISTLLVANNVNFLIHIKPNFQAHPHFKFVDSNHKFILTLYCYVYYATCNNIYKNITVVPALLIKITSN